LSSAEPHAQLALLFEFVAVAMAVVIPWGSGADRWRLAAGCSSAAVLAGIVFPLAAHWIWAGGWLQMLGANFTLGDGFLDGGGAATVHTLGGLSALAVAWIAGPRKGKFPKEGLSLAMPGHSAVYVLFGCLLALVGWLAWNAAGAILWVHEPLSALPGTAVSTLLSASAALAATCAVTRFRFGKPDASLCANGWLAGLVASSACACVATPAESIFVGAVAGIFTPLMVEALELALSIDDPSGGITVHGAAGLWGLLAAGFFAPHAGQLLAQLVGIAALLGVVLPLVYLLFALLNRVVPFRADADGERIGMDLHELGGGAYPDFVIHRDESYR
jgi:ammonium transporter, Amt family